MPDENKFAKLREVHYRIPITCGMCVHGPEKGEEWGECQKHRYHHKKHDNPARGRGVSVHALGTCDEPELRTNLRWRLGHHVEFLESE